MYPTQHTMSCTMLKEKHVLYAEDHTVPSSHEGMQKSFFAQSFNKISNINTNIVGSLRNICRVQTNNRLSVTVVNSSILTGDTLSKNLSMKIRDLSYTSPKEKLHDLKQAMPIDFIESMCPVWKRGPSWVEGAPEIDHMEDWDVVDDFNIKIRNDVNIKNSGDTYDNNTTESHSMQVKETGKTINNNMTDNSDSLVVDPQKYKVDIHKDTDVKSFHVISDSDISTIPRDFVEENSESRFSNACRKVWFTVNNFASQFYSKTQTARMFGKRPVSYPTKQHHRRKANTIAMGRGRGRAKGQLRRSGVSQTVYRKECIKNENDETLQNNLIGTAPNDCQMLDRKFDNMDPVQITKQFDSPSTSGPPKAIPMKTKPKARKKKTKAKYVTKVRYIAKSSNMNERDYCEDSNNEIQDVQQDSRLRTLSDSADVENEWLVFEDDDKENLSETREKRGATEYPIRARYVPNYSITKNDDSCEDPSSETHDEKFSFRLRSSSESSTDSEDTNSTVSNEQEAMKCSKIIACLTKINKDIDSQMQKNSFRHRRLSSDTSDTSDGSNISEISNSSISDSDNSIFFLTEEDNEIDSDDEIIFFDGNEDNRANSIIFNDENSEELKVQTKKVSFNLAPVVHVMVTWNYAYRAARKGPWEEIARDNERFKGRINSIALVLDPILKSSHRSQIFQERFAFSE